MGLAALWAVWGASEPAASTATSTAASTAAPAPAGATASEATSPAVAAPKPGLADVPWGEVASSRPVWALTASHASYA